MEWPTHLPLEGGGGVSLILCPRGLVTSISYGNFSTNGIQSNTCSVQIYE